ncbi:hypothetical protein VTK26DRAFT_8324 [Humicola hyalothermophila]
MTQFNIHCLSRASSMLSFTCPALIPACSCHSAKGDGAPALRMKINLGTESTCTFSRQHHQETTTHSNTKYTRFHFQLALRVPDWVPSTTQALLPLGSTSVARSISTIQGHPTAHFYQIHHLLFKLCIHTTIMSFSTGNTSSGSNAVPARQPIDLNEYRYKSSELPRYLYRIEHPNTQSRHDLNNGDTFAANPFMRFYNKSAFLGAVDNHVDINSTRSSPFLSVFKSKELATNWAMLKLMDDHESWYNVRLVTIDVSKLKEPEELPLSLRKVRASSIRYADHWDRNNEEPLFVYRIPHAAIVKTESMGVVTQYCEFAEFPDDPDQIEKVEYWDLMLLDSDCVKQEQYDITAHGVEYARQHKHERPTIYKPGQKPKPPQPVVFPDPNEESEFVKCLALNCLPPDFVVPNGPQGMP